MGIVLVGGIHGVGKSFIIQESVNAQERYIPILKGSTLMAHFLGISPEDLPFQSPEARNEARAYMYKKLRETTNGIRDGHFCVYTDQGYEFPVDDQDKGIVTAAVVILAEPEIILKRRLNIDRNRPKQLALITEQQNLETAAARHYSDVLAVPLYEIDNSGNPDNAIIELAAVIGRHV